MSHYVSLCLSSDIFLDLLIDENHDDDDGHHHSDWWSIDVLLQGGQGDIAGSGPELDISGRRRTYDEGPGDFEGRQCADRASSSSAGFQG